MTDSDQGVPTFEGDIKSLFREGDREAMLPVFDLWSYNDVNANADAIVAAVRGGSMPCDEPWPSERVDLLQRWIDSGTPEKNEAAPG